MSNCTPSSSSDTCPRVHLYPHVLGSIYAFLRLAELVPVTSVSKLWLSSVVSAPCIGAVLPSTCKLAAVCSSALATQLASCEDQGSVSVEQITRIARGCPNLHTLRCQLTLSAPATARTLLFPSKLTHLSLRIPFGTAVVRIHSVFTLLSLLPHLTFVHLTLPSCDPLLSFAAFRRASVQHLQIEWTWAGSPLTDEQIAQLGAIQHLHSLQLPTPSLALMQRLFKPGHPFKQLQSFCHLKQVDETRAALLVAIPSLTRLSLENCLADLAFLTQLPNLAYLRVSLGPQTAARSCLALLDCPHLTDLSVKLWPISEDDLCAVIERHHRLRRLTVQLHPSSNVRFLPTTAHNTTLTSLTLTRLEPRLLRLQQSHFAFLRSLTELRLHCAQSYVAYSRPDIGIPAHVPESFRLPCESLPSLLRFSMTQPWERDPSQREEL